MELSYNIKLYNIEGISRSDTPYFSDSDSQDDYFESKLVHQITTSFFPPFFTDEITFDDTDLTIFTKVNYLSVKFSDKVFYYFIDGINYNNSGSLSLKIAMDTIQTFMFDFSVKNGVIERKFIDRWNSDGTINRNYLRENVSSNLFQLLKFKAYSCDSNFKNKTNTNIIGYLVFKMAKDIWDNDGGFSNDGTPYVRTPSGNEFYRSQFYYYILPVGKNSFLQQNCKFCNRLSSHDVLKDFRYDVTLYYLAADPSCIECKFLPLNNFAAMCYSPNESGSTFYVDDTACNIRFHDYGNGKVAAAISFKTGMGMQVEALEDDFLNFDMSKNIALNTAFDKRYCPCLIDENYYRLSFGEGSTATTFTLFDSTSTKFTCRYFCEPDTGSRYYQIIPNSALVTPSGNFYDYVDCYQCTTVTTNAENYDLTQSSWIQYQEYNKASIGMALGGYSLKCFAFGMAGSSALKANSARANEIFTKGSENGFIPEKDWTEWKGILADNKSIKSSMVSKGAEAGSSLIGTATTEYNAWLGPNSARSTGNMFRDMLSHSLQIYSAAYVCNNIEECAQYYHRNGYLVNEYFNPLISTSDNYTSSSYIVNSLGKRTISFSFSTSDNHLYNGNGTVSLMLSVCHGSLVSSSISVDSTRTIITVTATVDITSIEDILRSNFNILVTYTAIHSISIIDYVHTRHYFNVLKMKDCDIYLNMLESNDIVSDISSRLIDGIRLWDVSFGELCDFRFDNVERSYLS